MRRFAFELRKKYQIPTKNHPLFPFFNTIICWRTGGWWLACLLMLNSNSVVLGSNFTAREHIVLSSKALCIIAHFESSHHAHANTMSFI
jgi:hypothetical protein